MPDPRQPQRPQPPARQQPPPQRGQPAERPVPHDKSKDHLAVSSINVGDPEAAARAGRSRPVRPLTPEQQPPPVEYERKIKKGETYWIMGSEELPTPKKGKIIVLSSAIGKTVGVEFEEPIGGVDAQGGPWGTVHTCDGRGKPGHCLYVRPDQVLDEKSMQAFKAHRAQVEKDTPKFDEYEEITVGPQHSMPLTPSIEMKALPGGNGAGEKKEEDEDEDEDKDDDK
jgi:hypothetical protein